MDYDNHFKATRIVKYTPSSLADYFLIIFLLLQMYDIPQDYGHEITEKY